MPTAFPELEEVATDSEGSPRLGRTVKLNELIELLQGLKFVNVTLKDSGDNDVTIRVLSLDEQGGTLDRGTVSTISGTFETFTVIENGTSVSKDLLVDDS